MGLIAHKKEGSVGPPKRAHLSQLVGELGIFPVRALLRAVGCQVLLQLTYVTIVPRATVPAVDTTLHLYHQNIGGGEELGDVFGRGPLNHFDAFVQHVYTAPRLPERPDVFDVKRELHD